MSELSIINDPLGKLAGSLPILPKSDIAQASMEINLLSDDGDYYLSTLFNIEASQGYKAIKNLKSSKEYPEERFWFASYKDNHITS